MGVRGLQTFLKNNTQLYERVELNNTTLLIDASNLQCNIYFVFSRDANSQSYNHDKYGGNLVAYGQEVRKFFKALELCNITPVLVYDGSTVGKQSTADKLTLKDKENHRRGLDKFDQSKLITEDSQGDFLIMSSLTSAVFKAIVRELGIQIIQAPYEADTHLARLAHDLKCPILTNDSDFIIYSLPVGFIILDTFNYKSPIKDKTSDSHSIECFVFSQAKLVQALPGLEAETLPFLSILLGNDFVAAGTFDAITEHICRRSYYGKLVAKSKSHFRIANMLEWLKGKSLDQAIEYILSLIVPEKRESIRKAIKILLQNYNIEQEDNFEAELEAIYPPDKAAGNDDAEPKLMPAAYLAQQYGKSELSGAVLDIIFHNAHYAHALIDDLSKPSSGIAVKYRPLSLAVTLLRTRTYEGMTADQREIEIQRDAYRYFDRLKSEYVLHLIRPMEYLEKFGSLEHLTLYSTVVLEPAMKRSMLFATFRFDEQELEDITSTLSKVFRESFVDESRLCLLLVKYIGIETKSAPKPEFVDSLMLTLFYYAALGDKVDDVAYPRDECSKIILELMDHPHKNNGVEYEPSPALFRTINHFISQLQSAYVAFNLINSLLGFVMPFTRVESFFNGVLIFRLTKLFQMGDLKMDQICSELPALLDICDRVRELVHCAA